MKKREHIITQLSKEDRKILDKYSKNFTNYIESPTATNNLLDNKIINPNL